MGNFRKSLAGKLKSLGKTYKEFYTEIGDVQVFPPSGTELTKNPVRLLQYQRRATKFYGHKIRKDSVGFRVLHLTEAEWNRVRKR